MITISKLASIIAMVCQMESTTIDPERKIECFEYMTNCSVVHNGEIPKDNLDKCIKLYTGK